MWSAANSLYCSPCADGFICELGETSPTPAGKTCVDGFVCNSDDLTASAYTKIACPPGYQSKVVVDHKSYLGSCEICIAGKYCYAGTVLGGALDCPIGHYCPIGTQYAT